MEDAVAAGDGVAQRVGVEQVGPAQHKPLGGAGEAPQVRVLGVICTQTISASQRSTETTTPPPSQELYINAGQVGTGVPDGASDGVALVEEELDDPRPDVPAGAGHAHRLPVPRGGLSVCAAGGHGAAKRFPAAG